MLGEGWRLRDFPQLIVVETMETTIAGNQLGKDLEATWKLALHRICTYIHIFCFVDADLPRFFLVETKMEATLMDNTMDNNM